METDLDLGDFFMDYWIIGDVHACYFTLTELLKIWQPENENLIFVGDLVNKGNYSEKVLHTIFELSQIHPKKVKVVKGNHEILYLKKTKKYNLKLVNDEILDWVETLPMYIDFDHFFVSHSGISIEMNNLNDFKSTHLAHRKPLQNIAKRQFIGHNVIDEIFLDEKTNVCYLDTGAGFGKFLSAVKINELGEILQKISIPVHKADFTKT